MSVITNSSDITRNYNQIESEKEEVLNERTEITSGETNGSVEIKVVHVETNSVSSTNDVQQLKEKAQFMVNQFNQEICKEVGILLVKMVNRLESKSYKIKKSNDVNQIKKIISHLKNIFNENFQILLLNHPHMDLVNSLKSKFEEGISTIEGSNNLKSLHSIARDLAKQIQGDLNSLIALLPKPIPD